MEVILIENIEKLGKVGDVVKVKDGYARNYLIPKKKVLRANKENLKVFDEKKSVIEAEEKKRKEKSEEIAKKIKNLEIIIIRNAAENGQLYGSVTSKDIVKEILLLNKIELLNEQINLKKTLKAGSIFGSEGLAMNISVYADDVQAEFLPLSCNWIASNVLPKYDQESKSFVEPYLPNKKIGIMHLAAGIWNDKKDMRVNKDIKIPIETMQGNKILKSLRYGIV